MTSFSYHSHITDCLIGSPINQYWKILDISTLFSRKFTTMAAEYSCILKELLGDGWVRLRGGGKRRGVGLGRLIEGGGEGRPARKNLQSLALHRLASLLLLSIKFLADNLIVLSEKSHYSLLIFSWKCIFFKHWLFNREVHVMWSSG